MKAFVTGGTGFIGSHLVDALIAGGEYDEIRCLVRSGEKWLRNKSYTKIRGDLHEIFSLRKAMVDVDVVFHLAGVVKAADEITFERVNVEGAKNIFRAARDNDVPKIVVMSSQAAAGPSRGRPIDEKAPMKPVSRYGRSKMKMEQMINRIADEHASITILRPGAVYGPREGQIYSFFKMANKHLCPIAGNGQFPKISMVYVDDVVQGCLKAAAQRSPGVETYFIAGEPPHSWNEIRGITERVLGKKTIPIYIKPAIVEKMGAFFETAASFLGSYPVINRDKAKELVLEWTCSIEKAKKELNFVPSYSLDEGFSRTIHWYKKHHWL
jgi:nucleoside-diphosphate-sugar epimerase